MPEEPQERTYKHQVSADFVVEAITTLEWSAAQTKRFNEKGIYRGLFSEFKSIIEKEESSHSYPKENDNCTLLLAAEISDSKDLILQDIQTKIPHIIIYGYNLYNVEIKSASLNRESSSNFNETTQFYILDSYIGNIDIEDSIVGNFGIYQNSAVGDIDIEDSSTGEFSLREYSTMNYIEISNSDLKGFALSSNSFIGGFIAFDCTITSIWIVNGSFIGHLDLQNSEILDINIFDKSIAHTIHYNGSKSNQLKVQNIQSSFYFNKATIEQCELKNCDIWKLSIKNECKMGLYISGGSIDLIDFDQLSLGKNTTLSFSKIALYAINMNEFSVLGNLYFRGILKNSQYQSPIAIKKYLDSMSQNENLPTYFERKKKLLEEIKKTYEKNLRDWQNELNIDEPTFRIGQSSLGKTEFTECDLGAFRFEYNNSKLTETFISGGTLPERVTILNENKKTNILDQQKAFFNQLKKIFDNQGDIVRSNYYQAKAAEKQTLISILKFRPFEFLVYFFNLISNNHGRSWFVALLFIVSVSHTGFYFYNGALTNPIYSFEWGNTDYLGDLAKFVLPTHKFDFLGFEPNSKAVVIDFVSRLFIGYGIFQFISAFRKHGKRA